MTKTKIEKKEVVKKQPVRELSLKTLREVVGGSTNNREDSSK